MKKYKETKQVEEITFEQVFDGDWIEPKPQIGHKMKCCDCGLIHTINFRVDNGKVQFQAFRESPTPETSNPEQTPNPQEDQPLPDKEGYWVKAEDRLPEDMWQGKFRDVRDNSLKEYRGIHELDKGRFSKGSIIFPSRFVEYYVNAKPKEDKPERLFTLEDLAKSHWRGWFVRERYNGPDRHGYEDKLPKNWGEMDYDEHEEWFFSQFIKETFGIDIKINQP